MSRSLAILLVALIIGGGFYWWRQHNAPEPVAPEAPAEVAPPAAPAPAPAESEIKYPIGQAEPTTSEQAPQPITQEALVSALVGLLGQDAVTTYLRTTDFPRRVVATVDNLGRTHAAPQVWPVHPAPGRFTVEKRADGNYISPGNRERYEDFVRFVESVDTGRATALYVQFYPLFQSAYEELGYPGRYFNDRLVQTIDLMLQTPDAPWPPQVVLTELTDGRPFEMPWLHYRYVDPQLEALAPGQKMLLRMAPEQRKRLQQKLAQIRRAITGGQGPKS